MTFGEHFVDIMKEQKLTNSEISRKTGIPTSRISNFAKNINLPSVDNSILLANCFHCSLDFLLGREKRKDYIIETRVFDLETFLSKYKELLDIHKMSNRKLSDEININKSGLFHWQSGQKPQIKIALKIVDYFNCSLDYLLCKSIW